jgi:hypothetical protein
VMRHFLSPIHLQGDPSLGITTNRTVYSVRAYLAHTFCNRPYGKLHTTSEHVQRHFGDRISKPGPDRLLCATGLTVLGHRCL